MGMGGRTESGLYVDAFYQQNQVPAICTICGRSTGGRFSPPVRFVLRDNDEEVGEICERCAYGSVDLWRVALIEYAIRLETQAAVLRDLARRAETGHPAPEGIAEDIIRKHIDQSGPSRPGDLPPWLRGR
jgi:hypothetical protein